jgi:hypothetical protein
VADSSATHHITPSVGNISTLRPLTSSNSSSIVVGNGSSLMITSVGDSVLPRPFYLNNILFAPEMVQSLLFVRHFTTDNWCSMEFDLFGLSVKDLTTKNVIIRSNSTGPLYMMHLPGSLTPSSSVVATLAAVPHALTDVALIAWFRCLGHHGPATLSRLSRSTVLRPAPGGGYWSPDDTWRLQRCPEPGGGRQRHGDTWHPQSCPEPRGGYHSTAPIPCPSVGGQGMVTVRSSNDHMGQDWLSSGA